MVSTFTVLTIRSKNGLICRFKVLSEPFLAQNWAVNDLKPPILEQDVKSAKLLNGEVTKDPIHGRERSLPCGFEPVVC